MTYYLSVLAFGLFYLVAMGGWGALFAKTLRIGNRGLGLHACWGLSLSIIIGGILNAQHAVSRPALLAYLGVGFSIAAITKIRRLNNCAEPTNRGLTDRSPISRGAISSGTMVGVIFLMAVIAVRYANAAAYTGYQPRDDHGAYFVFPVKMLETGTLGQDPFSERRLTNSIGGCYFLQAMLLAGVKPQNLNLLDRGIALLLITSLTFDLMRDRRASWPATLVVLSVATFSILPRANISSSLLSCCLFFALYRSCLITRDNGMGWLRGSILISLTFAGTISLKSTMLPPTGLYVLLFFGHWFWFWPRKFAIMATGAATGLFTLVFLILWMLDMRQSGGTMWFPILGKGFHMSAYGPFPMPSDDVRLTALPAVLRQVFILLIACVPLMFLGVLLWRKENRSDLVVVCCAVLIGACALSVATGGLAIQRFTAPFLFAASIICLAETIDIPGTDHRVGGPTRWTQPMPLFSVLCAGLILGDSFQTLRLGMAPAVASMRSFARGRTGEDIQKRDRYRAAQSTVPVGAVILTSLDDPYYLDFQRNTVQIADLPIVSPPPGMPRFQGPKALADYLLHLKIRYVAYAYSTEACYRFEDFKGDLAPTAHPWMRGEAGAVFDLHNNFQRLGQTRRKLYDDGEVFVLDLASPALKQ